MKNPVQRLGGHLGNPGKFKKRPKFMKKRLMLPIQKTVPGDRRPAGPSCEHGGRVAGQSSNSAGTREEMTPDGVTGKPKIIYISECYAVRQHLVKFICQQFQVQPVVDLFANAENARFGNFITEEVDAFSLRWPRNTILWANPPWSLWPRVVDKIYEDGSQVVCVAPAWRTPWMAKLWSIQVKRIYLQKGEQVFELAGRPCRGTRWGVWVLLVNGELANTANQAAKAPSTEEKTRLHVPSEQGDAQAVGHEVGKNQAKERVRCRAGSQAASGNEASGQADEQADNSIWRQWYPWSGASRRRYRRKLEKEKEQAMAAAMAQPQQQ